MTPDWEADSVQALVRHCPETLPIVMAELDVVRRAAEPVEAVVSAAGLRVIREAVRWRDEVEGRG